MALDSTPVLALSNEHIAGPLFDEDVCLTVLVKRFSRQAFSLSGEMWGEHHEKVVA